jgi:hypothetical protein
MLVSCLKTSKDLRQFTRSYVVKVQFDDCEAGAFQDVRLVLGCACPLEVVTEDHFDFPGCSLRFIQGSSASKGEQRCAKTYVPRSPFEDGVTYRAAKLPHILTILFVCTGFCRSDTKCRTGWALRFRQGPLPEQLEAWLTRHTFEDWSSPHTYPLASTRPAFEKVLAVLRDTFPKEFVPDDAWMGTWDQHCASYMRWHHEHGMTRTLVDAVRLEFFDRLDSRITIGHTPEWQLGGGSWREHVVPCACLVAEVLEMLRRGQSDEAITQTLQKNMRIILLAKNQHEQLDARFRQKMPDGWRFGCSDGIFARFLETRMLFFCAGAAALLHTGEQVSLQRFKSDCGSWEALNCRTGERYLNLPCADLRVKPNTTESFNTHDLVEAHSLTGADLNGKCGNVIQFQGERVVVQFTAEIGSKALKPGDLKHVSE